jgi:hypothetical protein
VSRNRFYSSWSVAMILLFCIEFTRWAWGAWSRGSRRGASEKEHMPGGWVSAQAWNEPPSGLLRTSLAWRKKRQPRITVSGMALERRDLRYGKRSNWPSLCLGAQREFLFSLLQGKVSDRAKINRPLMAQVLQSSAVSPLQQTQHKIVAFSGGFYLPTSAAQKKNHSKQGSGSVHTTERTQKFMLCRPTIARMLTASKLQSSCHT